MSQPAKRTRRRHVSPAGERAGDSLVDPGADVVVEASKAAVPKPSPTPAAAATRTMMAGNSRIQVPATEDEKNIIKAAADLAGYANVRSTGGMGTYIAKRILTVAQAELAGEAPLVLSPKVAASVAELAKVEGCSVDELITRATDMLRAVRASTR